MKLKIGLEVEFFALKNETIVICPTNIPHDEYPLLVEARGMPSIDVFQAVASVRGEMDRVIDLMDKQSLKPCVSNWIKIDKHIDALKEQILRQGINKRINYQNLYGDSISKKNKNHLAAGLHVSFTNEKQFNYSEKSGDGVERKSFNYYAMFDYPQIFRRIEKEFEREIAESGRVKGFYEIKEDGRIEYRSLPATLIYNLNFASRLNRAIYETKQ